jgi:hypothetical protein
MPQPSLFDAPPPPVPGSLEGRFRAFHADHPEVYACLRELAREKRRQGRRSYSMKGLYELARVLLEQPLNNDFTPLYARLLMAENPDLVGFFRLRERHAV